MPLDATSLRGVLMVLQTPYHPDFTIDVPTLQREVDWVLGHGARGLVLGMVSEVLRLADGERDALVKAVADAAKGRGPVVASVGAESAAQAVRHAKAARDAGADALMAMPPLLARPGEDELRAYYESILAATPLPLVIQDASGYLGQSIPIGLQAGLFRAHPGRVFFKPEPNPAGPAVTALLEATDGKAVVFEGQGGRELLDTRARGAKGTMPGADLPWVFSALWAALERGDLARAKQIHEPLATLSRLPDTLDAWLEQEKRLLVRQGVFPNALIRGPRGRGLAEGAPAEGDRLFEILRGLCPQRM